MIWIRVLILCVFVSIPILKLGAATDVFLINTTVGVDVAAPATPLNILANPVSASQINVSWSATTDNFGVTGYQIYRNGLQIATTTATSFLDTGLAAGTKFLYQVTAFDAAGNISTFSSSSVATTFSLPAAATTTPPVSSGGGSGGFSRGVDMSGVTISNLIIESFAASVVVTFETNVPVQSRLRWGRTASYEIGFSATESLKTQHRLLITDLIPAAVYDAELRVIDQAGAAEMREVFSFQAAAGEDVTAPANVMNLVAQPVTDGVALSWQNPADLDFSRVRIMSSDRFYPTSEVDGYLVYEGDGQRTFDDRTMTGTIRYYTAFTYDSSNNISSGAVTFIRAPSAEDVDTVVRPTTTEVLIAAEPTVIPMEIFITQPGVEPQNLTDQIRLMQGEVTTISIPYTSLPKHLKTVLVTMRHPIDQAKTFSFLLTVNNDRSAYEAVIGGLEVLGEYVTEVEVFDFKTQTVTKASGVVEVVAGASARTAAEPNVAGWRWLLSVFLVGCLVWLLWWRRLSDKDEDSAV